MQKRSASQQIYGLDLLRFFAASLVMVYHFAFLSWADPGTRGQPEALLFAPYRPLAPWIGTGWIGVQIFFVISGFVIAYTANGKSPLDFLNSRFLRLWPGVLVCAALSLGTLILAGQPGGPVIRSFLLSLVLWPTGPWIASAYWTLPIEIVFYAFVFLILWRDRFDRIEAAAAAIGLGCTALWCAYFLRGWLPERHLATAIAYLMEKRLPKLILVQHACLFALGILTWLIAHRGWTLRRAGVAACLATGCLLQILAETIRANAWNGYSSDPATPLAIWLAAMLFMAGAIAANATVARWVGRYGRQVRALGLATYPLYLLHQPVGGSLLVHLLRAGTSPVLALVLAIAFTVALALIVALWIEPLVRAAVRSRLLAAECRMPVRWDNLRQPRRAVSGPSLVAAPSGVTAESPP